MCRSPLADEPRVIVVQNIAGIVPLRGTALHRRCLRVETADGIQGFVTSISTRVVDSTSLVDVCWNVFLDFFQVCKLFPSSFSL